MKLMTGLFDALCRSRWERQVVEALCSSNVGMTPELCQHIDTILSACTAFEEYQAIAQCHTLCVAAAPANKDTWLRTVLDHLILKARSGDSCDAYEMGALIGLFQAGKWLQDHMREPFSVLLTEMARYCHCSASREFRLVNSGGGQLSLSTAQQNLDQAVKAYLRSEKAVIKEQLCADTRGMLLRLQESPISQSYGRPGPWRWLTSSLVHGVLNIEYRDQRSLIAAALTLTP